MEKVEVIAKTGFVNDVVGSVTRKQKLNLTPVYADFLAGLGLVEYSKKSQVPALETVGGSGEQSASLLAETVLPTATLPKPKGGRPKKAGK